MGATIFFVQIFGQLHNNEELSFQYVFLLGLVFYLWLLFKNKLIYIIAFRSETDI